TPTAKPEPSRDRRPRAEPQPALPAFGVLFGQTGVRKERRSPGRNRHWLSLMRRASLAAGLWPPWPSRTTPAPRKTASWAFWCDCDTRKTPKRTQYSWALVPLPCPAVQIGTTIVQPVQLSNPSVVVQASPRATTLRIGPAWTPVSACHQPGTETSVAPSVRPLKLVLPAPQSGTWGPWRAELWFTAAGLTIQELHEASSS